MRKPVLIKTLGRRYATSISKKKSSYGLYKCECGEEFACITRSVSTGNTRSCGCLAAADTVIRNNKELHNRYKLMLSRCYNKEAVNYGSYGGAGVTVCEEWLGDNGFANYVKWATSCSSYNLQLEIDKDILSNRLGIKPAVYSPETCQFVTSSINKLARGPISGKYKGVSETVEGNFRARIYLNGREVSLGRYPTELEASKVYDYYLDLIGLDDAYRNNTLTVEDDFSLCIDKNGYINKNVEHSKYYGVTKLSSGKWVSSLKIKQKRNYLGSFDAEEDAAQAVNSYLIANNYNLHKLNKIE